MGAAAAPALCNSDAICFLLNSPPGPLDVPPLRIGLADAHPQRELVTQASVCEVEVAAPIQRVHEPLVLLISRFQAEAHKV